MLNVKLYLAQRLSAMLMAPLVLMHLALMVYSIQGGLDSVEILSRTQGSVGWGLFYGLFVVAVSVHAAIGVRVIACEWWKVSGPALEILTWTAGLVLLMLGSFAIAAVVL